MQLQSEYGPGVFQYVEFHIVQGLSNPSTTARWADYGNLGTPTVFFDGLNSVTGAANAYENYKSRIDARILAEPPLLLDAEVTLDETGGMASVAIAVEMIAGQMIPMPEECFVRAVLYEDDVVFCCGPQGQMIWDHVARDFHYGVQLDLAAIPGRQDVSLDWTLDPGWIRPNLKAIAFVQRGVTGEILNAVQATIVDPDAVDAASWGRIKSLYR